MDSHELPPDDRRPALQPPRFGLFALLMAIGVIGALCAVLRYFGAYGAVIAILFFLCVVAHVVGNAMGTKLRDCGDRPVDADGLPNRRTISLRKPLAADFGPVTKLSSR